MGQALAGKLAQTNALIRFVLPFIEYFFFLDLPFVN